MGREGKREREDADREKTTDGGDRQMGRERKREKEQRLTERRQKMWKTGRRTKQTNQ